MKILLVGSGSVTSGLVQKLSEQGHTISAMLGNLTPGQMEVHDHNGIVVVSPETTTSTETLTKAAELGKLLYIIAGAQDSLAGWAAATRVPTYAYPPAGTEVDALLAELRRADAGTANAADQYRRVVLGGDAAARITSSMVARKIAVTSPKGGVGKTTIAVNLALLYALSGYNTFLVDADGNGGTMSYLTKLDGVNNVYRSSVINLLRRQASARTATVSNVMVAAGGAYFDAFTPIPSLPTLKVLPGLVTVNDLADPAMGNEQLVNEVMAGLYDAGVLSNGIVIMDIGINPSHPIHRAALRNAEVISIVATPEASDLGAIAGWVENLIHSLRAASSKEAAMQFVWQRVKLCYNKVDGREFKSIHNLLLRTLESRGLNLQLVANGVIPYTDRRLARTAVNSDRIEDNLLWRYRRERCEEIGDFTEALIDYASQFTPNIRQSAAAAGIVAGAPASGTKRKNLFFGWGAR
jgi:MinD-like ATPase involved in chromosome partitioning or flagellar assembly